MGDSRYDKQSAYTSAYALMQMGVMPNAELLSQAGITTLEAQEYIRQVTAQLKRSTGTASAGGGSPSGDARWDSLVTRMQAGDYSAAEEIKRLYGVDDAWLKQNFQNYTPVLSEGADINARTEAYLRDLQLYVQGGRIAWIAQIEKDYQQGNISLELMNAVRSRLGLGAAA